MSQPKNQENMLTVHYQSRKRFSAGGLGFSLLCLLIYFCFQTELPVIEMIIVLGSVFLFSWLFDIATTQKINFYPDRVEKINFLWTTVIPVNSIVIKKDYDFSYIRFFYGSKDNIRESFKVYNKLLSRDLAPEIINYIESVYEINMDNQYRKNEDSFNKEFNYAASVFRQYLTFSVIYLAVYQGFQIYYLINSNTVVANEFSNNILLARLAVFAGVLAGYLQLKRLALVYELNMPAFSLMNKMESSYIYSVVIICNIAIMGLPLFIYTANKLDFYALLLVSILFFYEFYPRLSVIERVCQGNRLTTLQNQKHLTIPRRSLEVSLILAGSLTVAGHAERHARVDQNICGENGSGYFGCNRTDSSSGSYRNTGDYDHRSTARRGGFGGFAKSFFSSGG